MSDVKIIETTTDGYVISFYRNNFHTTSPNGEDLDRNGDVVPGCIHYESGDAKLAIARHRWKNTPPVTSIPTMSEGNNLMSLETTVATFIGIQITHDIRDLLGDDWEESDGNPVFGVTLGDGDDYFLAVASTYQDIEQVSFVALNGDDNLILANETITDVFTAHGATLPYPISTQRFVIHNLG